MMKFLALVLCISTIWVNASKIQSSSKGLRIIGGDEANAAQFPFAVSINKQTAAGTYFCAGALISNQWVLTAGQCVSDAVAFTIRMGSNSLTNNDANAVRVATDSYVLHPDFNPLTLENDVGLIKLRLPVTLTDYIKPVSVLASSNLPDSSVVLTMGWGQISDDQAGVVDELRYVYLVTLSNEECRLAYGNAIVDSMVCVEGNYNEGTCRGDLGSPLIQYGGSSLTYHVGISSFISGNGCESTDPSGFVRTSPYVDWIKNVTEIE